MENLAKLVSSLGVLLSNRPEQFYEFSRPSSFSLTRLTIRSAHFTDISALLWVIRSGWYSEAFFKAQERTKLLFSFGILLLSQNSLYQS